MLKVLAAAHAPATLAALSESLGGHPNTTRAQLEHLVSAGFATETSLPASGRGRPARAWRATLDGRQVAGEAPDRELWDPLLEAMAEHLASGPEPGTAAREVGRGWGVRLVAAGSDDLVGVLTRQGFTPEPDADGIALRTCPLLDAAVRRPDVVCGIHQGMIDAIADSPQRLLPFARPGACLVRPA